MYQCIYGLMLVPLFGLAQVTQPGVIRGNVLTEKGNPLTYARVMAFPQISEQRPVAFVGAIPQAVTDDKGQFHRQWWSTREHTCDSKYSS